MPEAKEKDDLQLDELGIDEEVEEIGAASIDPDEEMPEEQAQSALDAMLSSKPMPVPTEKYRISRLNLTVTLRGVQERQIEQVGRRSERAPSKQERVRGIVAAQRDTTQFNTLLVAEGLADPDLNNQELLTKFGPRPEDVVRNWFLPGEIIQMADLVMDLAGYGEEAVVRAKK